MGLKCPKCGTDNLLTAIFCRGCGERLNLNELKPDEIMETKKPQGMTKGQKIVFACLAGVVILIGLGLISPAGGLKAEASASSTAEAAFKAVQEGIKKPSTGKKGKKGKKKAEEPAPAEEAPAEAKSFTFTSQDATTLLSKAMNLPGNGGDVVPTNFSVQFKDDNVIRCVLSTKIYDFLPMDNVVNIKWTCNGKGSADFEVISKSIGIVPLPGELGKIVLEKMRPIVDGCQALKKIKNNAAQVNGGEDSLTIGL